ncbi:hypothetical protein I302_102966 [Kwoniella bestiolae CBS 10118]|uniref:L domain-like protein n=1 Tax=Kwoniella bestiolae CBS 10118 TaxID=1296100 RepID=A0A1B9GGF6_9TREE|nr:hypothetical protein I302_01662 [Kwoniella bestiolae CBS 10118]OCF30143.1 hypothetical protein I302_01662 [Kwoniella bestiolae CBS 10118]
MDRGAARSKKRALKAQSAAQQTASQAQQPQAGPSKTQPETQQRKDDPVKTKPRRKDRNKREEQSKDPSLYVPKAIRTSSALIYSQTPFPIPPPAEVLANVRRVDLSGSGVRDVSFLKDAKGVTWLSLNGCQIERGWEEVGGLEELAVLNIKGCGLKVLPSSLSRFPKLKALVAMNNDWTKLDEDVLSGWKELNSLIISHSPNLLALPSSLSSLHHLSKLTFSHCPKLTSDSLPNLSSLPLLRDVKMNNLPLLTDLPPHIVTWGKGPLSLVGKKENEYGDGLEVLDLGNCSLSFESVKIIFGLSSYPGKKGVRWDHLRSLSLHSNPLTSTTPNYVELLQNSEGLPNLQIIDAKRIIERKRKGEISERKIKHREKGAKPKPSGSNMTENKEMRKWGGAEVKEGLEEIEKVEGGEEAIKVKRVKPEKMKKEKEKTESKKRKHNDQPPLASTSTSTEERSKKQKRTRVPSPPATPAPLQSNKDITDSSRIPKSTTDEATSQKDKSKHRDAVVGLIEINARGEEVQLDAKKKKKLKAKMKKDGGEAGRGVDLREVFGKNTVVPGPEGDGKEEAGDGWGLGVGGW